MRHLASTFAALVSMVAAAPAEAVLINNGLAPPNPANVIDGYISESVSVHNADCDEGPPCSAPGAPTSVLLRGSVLPDLGMGGLYVHESSSVTIADGGVDGDVVAFDSSTVLLLNGGVNYFLVSTGSASITMSGGNVGGIYVQDAASATISGGSIDSWIIASGSSKVTMSGGWLAEGHQIVAEDSATIRIFGTGFAVGGTPVGYGPIAASEGYLTGTLLAGSPIVAFVCHRGGGCNPSATGVITLVPEPSTGLLLSFGLVGLAAVRRNKMWHAYPIPSARDPS